jgi:hypothetical protein
MSRRIKIQRAISNNRYIQLTGYDQRESAGAYFLYDTESCKLNNSGGRIIFDCVADSQSLGYFGDLGDQKHNLPTECVYLGVDYVDIKFVRNLTSFKNREVEAHVKKVVKEKDKRRPMKNIQSFIEKLTKKRDNAMKAIE